MILNMFGPQDEPVREDYTDSFVLASATADRAPLYDWVSKVMHEAENIKYSFQQGNEHTGKYGYEFKVIADKK